jgi:hypothetical protein
MNNDHAVDTASNDPANPGEAITVTDILASYAAAGYNTEMRVTADASVHCHACGVDHPPRELLLDSVRRIEGASDPDDLQAVVALECVCGARGALVLAFGPGGAAEDADVFAALPDHREASAIPASQPPTAEETRLAQEDRTADEDQ